MTIERQHKKIIFICDECGDHYDTDSTEFYDALNRMKEEGWLTRRNEDDTEWEHICVECAP